MYKKYIKRLFDIILALIGLPFFVVFFLIISPVIYLTDKGPVLYNAPRIGKGGKIFHMYKFRSMKVDAPDIRNADGSTFNGEDDPRVTKVGRILRKTSLDEIPQILNVLKGDMSIVGPRAFLATTAKSYSEMDELRKKRLVVRPGITGYSQAYYRNSIGLEKKIEFDCFYVDNISFLMDSKILFKTALAVLLRKNIFVSSEGSSEVKQ